MLRLRYIIAPLILIASGLFLISNINNVTHAEEASPLNDDPYVENTFFTLNSPTSNLYRQNLAESTASEVYGQPVRVIIE